MATFSNKGDTSQHHTKSSRSPMISYRIDQRNNTVRHKNVRTNKIVGHCWIEFDAYHFGPIVVFEDVVEQPIIGIDAQKTKLFGR